MVEPYAAVIIGALAAPTYLAAAWCVRAMKVDDPLNAAAVHLLPGLWGLVAPGIFAAPVGGAVGWARCSVMVFGGGGRVAPVSAQTPCCLCCRLPNPTPTHHPSQPFTANHQPPTNHPQPTTPTRPS